MILSGSKTEITSGAIVEQAEHILSGQLQPTLRQVINATGVVIHTNLGRAPMSRSSINAVAKAARSYSNLEYDLDAGERGSRSVHAERLLRILTGAGAAHTVNNNAAAVLLMLSALCQGKEVIISRSQLVEIGGGFRVPDVMAQSGAVLVEVGTTNRTHARDYIDAINDETAAILVAHHSNFKIVGFTSEPSLAELASIAHQRGILLLYDQGSGAVRDTSQFGLAHEVTVQEALQAGVDIVAFSGDKLLGGPQAGILCGRDSLIDAIRRHPLARAVRADKMCLAALGETLSAYLIERVDQELPVWRMISFQKDELRKRALAWAERLAGSGIHAGVTEGHSTVGGGSLPGSQLPTWLVAIEADDVVLVEKALRSAETAVIGRIADNRLLLDPRTVLEEQDELLIDSVVRAVASTRHVERRENNDAKP
jgi:L-seryl-tRNA(Ser) seleniumtransferase